MAGEGNPFGRVFLPVKVLPHRVNILGRVDIRDDAGGRIPTNVLKKANVRAWVQPLSGTEQAEYARQDLIFTDRVIFFEDPQVMPEDVIHFGSRLLVVQGMDDGLSMGFVWAINTRDIGVNPP